jgi:hypothetical protein
MEQSAGNSFLDGLRPSVPEPKKDVTNKKTQTNSIQIKRLMAQFKSKHGVLLPCSVKGNAIS